MKKVLLIAFVCLTIANASVYSQCTPEAPILEALSGNTACLNASHGYRITNPDPNATYSWSVSSGGTLSQGSFLGYRTVNWTSPGTHRITVTPSNSCGAGPAGYIDIEVSEVNIPPQPVITGAIKVCLGSTVSYTANALNDFTVSWNTSPDYILVPDGNSAAVTFNSIGNVIITAFYAQGTCNGNIGLLRVTVIDTTTPTQPSIVSDDPGVRFLSSACQNQTVTYKAFSNDTDITYNWTLSGGGTITTNGNTATVNWTSQGNHSLSAYTTHLCGTNSSTSAIIVAVGAPSLVSLNAPVGPSTACTNSTQTYSVEPVGGAQVYVWEFPSNKPSTTTPILSYMPSAAQEGNLNLTVRVYNGFCNGPPSPALIINVTNAPTLPTIAGTGATCQGSIQTYSTPLDIGYTYNWSASNGSIIGSHSSTSVNAQWNLTGATGTIGVTVSNLCGTSSTNRTISLDSPTIPTPYLIGNNVLCQNYHSEFIVPNAPQGTNVLWDAPGATVTSQYQNTCGLKYNNLGTYTLTAHLSNSCGYLQSVSIPINVQTGTPPTPSLGFWLTGSNAACLNTSKDYATPSLVSGNYLWKVDNIEIPGNNTTNSILWNSSGRKLITATSYNASCQGTTHFLIVDVHNRPAPVITGANSVCTQEPCTYTTEPGKTSYIWTINGGHITSGEGTNTVTVVWDIEGAQQISVNYADENGCSAEAPTIQSVGVVSPSSQTISNFGPLSPGTYGDAPFQLSATATSGFPVTYSSSNTAVATITENTVTIVGAGTTTITASQEGGGCWFPASATQELVVSKASLVATAESKTKGYGDSNPPLTISYSGFRNNENASVLYSQPVVSTTATQFSNTGNYPISITGEWDDNYTITAVPGTLTITKAPLTVAADPKTKVYGDPNPALTFSYSGFKGSDNSSVLDTPPTATTPAGQFSSAGNYAITLNPGSDNNYEIIPVPGTLTITKATLTVAASANTKTYGELNPALSATYTGFRGTDDLTVIDNLPAVSTTATPCSSVGSYPVTLAGGSDNNYNFAVVNATLTITKAPLLVTANSYTKSYGTPNPAFDLTYSGFVCGDNGSALDALPSLSTPATQWSDVGNYPITLNGGSDNNYSLSLINGTLAINKADQVITFDPIPLKCSLGTVALVASSSSGLPVSFASSNTLIATISGSTANVLRAGTCTITATQAGSNNYNAAIPVARPLTAQNGQGTIQAPGGLDICLTGSVELIAGPGTSYQWNNWSTSRAITVYKASLFTVTYINSDGCPVTAKAKTIQSSPICLIARTASSETQEDTPESAPDVLQLSAYPNPANSVLTIAMPVKASAATPVFLYDNFGRTIATGVIQKDEWQTELPVKEIPGGIYIVRVGRGALINTTKVTIQHSDR